MTFTAVPEDQLTSNTAVVIYSMIIGWKDLRIWNEMFQSMIRVELSQLHILQRTRWRDDILYTALYHQGECLSSLLWQAHPLYLQLCT